MGELIRFPLQPGAVARAADRLERELAAARELERKTVEQALAAVEVGDLDHAAVRAVIMGRAGELEDYIQLCELIRMVTAARRHCGLST